MDKKHGHGVYRALSGDAYEGCTSSRTVQNKVINNTSFVKANGNMEKDVAKAYVDMLMVMFMMERGKIINEMEGACMFMLMVTLQRVSSKTTTSMVVESLDMRMAIFMKANISSVSSFASSYSRLVSPEFW
jgi:hypothetical protein